MTGSFVDQLHLLIFFLHSQDKELIKLELNWGNDRRKWHKERLKTIRHTSLNSD